MTAPGAKPKSSAAALDGRGARLAAMGVLLGILLLVAYIHRDAYLPAAESERAADDPVALCLAERAQGIDKMAAEGTISAKQAGLFKDRAEALCVAQHGQGSGPPPRQ